MKFDRAYRKPTGLLKLYLCFSLFFWALSCQSDSTTTPEIIPESKPLEELITEIEAGTYGEIHSLLISKDDRLILEKYFNGYEQDQLHRLYSVTKSITSALIGIALSQKKIQSIENRVLDSFTEYANIANLDSRKNAITIEDLLTMSAGLTWDESSTSYDSHANDAFKLGRSSDWMKHMLDLPMKTQPGTEFVYNSGGTMLLSGIIGKATA
ncbi:serine hydrolase [candidate division KSB1 bacterium]|nr:serine hydrolase [candidate division KSB1 bacterium]